jgi:hypothetical protein
MSPPFGWMMVRRVADKRAVKRSEVTRRTKLPLHERKEGRNRLAVRPTSFVCFFRCVSGCSSERERDSSRSAAIEAMPNCQRMPRAVHGDESRAQHGSIQLVNTRDGTSTNFKKRMNGRCRVRKPLAADLPCVPLGLRAFGSKGDARWVVHAMLCAESR